MNIVDIIIKKRDGKELTTEEINYFIREYTNGNLPDYQISALLMAIYFKGMNRRETADLTMAMALSGDCIDLSGIPGIKVDKHSTGGVADTTTLILAPLVAACGVPVIKMSGRGLGFTGGTIDKLESIPGFITSISIKQAIEFVKNSGLVIMGQTENLTPADKKLYALRDVTGTVDNISLIASSIMSKKIAAGADAIVLDVKCGSGAFMKSLDSAVSLGKEMVDIGSYIGKNIVAVISNMNQPLGMKIGNALEVEEAIEVLRGEKEGRLKELSLFIGAQMLLLAKKVTSIEEGKRLLESKINDGSAIIKLKEMIIQQGGDATITENTNALPKAKYSTILEATQDGYISFMDTARIGRAVLETGAGRTSKDDVIDPAAGIEMKVQIGDYVEKGEAIAELFSSTIDRLDRAKQILYEGIQISPHIPESSPLIYAVVTKSGIDYLK